jgi:hypothetical protein
MPRAHLAHDEVKAHQLRFFSVDKDEDSNTPGAFSAKHQNHAQN